MYNTGTFQTAASVLSLGPNDRAQWPFESGVSVSCSPLALLELSPADFQSRMLWGLIYPVQVARVRGAQCESDPLVGTLYLHYPSHLWVVPPTLLNVVSL